MSNFVNTNLIIEYLKNNKLSKTKFCDICKINIKTLNKILDGYDNFNLVALLKISRVMNIDLYEIFK